MAGLIAALLMPVLYFPPFHLIEERLYDILSVVSPPLPARPGAVIVAIDEPSIGEIGQRWPWSRELHARLVESLRAAGAKVIAFDIIFADPTTEEADTAFAKVLGPDVVLAADDVTTLLPQGIQVTRVSPLDPFLDAGAVSGVASVDLDGDAYLRRMPQMQDSLAAEALRLKGEPQAVAPAGALIQFFGPSRSYPTVSYYQALDPTNFLPPGFFKDQVVLVGLSLKQATSADIGAPDPFPTPFTLTEGTLTAGVEIQATILDNLRHNLYVLPVPRLVMALLVIAGAWLAAAFSAHGVSWRTGLAAAFLLAFFIAGSWVVLRFGRVWMPPAMPAAAALAVFGARFGLDYARERHLRRTVSEAFSRYLSPDLVAQLARDPGALKLGGERRNLSILFCDVRGFTTLSEKLKDEPERLTTLINRLLDPLSAAVLAEGGTIDKYIGDCVMAFWNAPLPSPDHPLRAARAAMGMLDAVKALNAELRREQGEDAPSFAIGVGINTGDCVVGNVGSRWRYDYSVLGDTVNLASRLESLSKEYGVSIVLGPATAKALQGHFVLIELDRIAVKGRAEKTAIFTIVAPASQRLDPALAELLEVHPTLLDSIRAGRRVEALELVRRCQTLAPFLSAYYGKLLLKATAIPE
ncbi:CHASE2 domain-containing protein [Microvirga mediterraneensis]|uniref:Adenylate/guanylate cyclase domain-containing protein n=1 Tax=Microvirga mediterraneensis TaxID=2754695 RepID=A0A838BHN1_9HYPH|nr:adenylate/guanylate cyclase domain-containing protein [Microvirga mediterraneensis]MBA1155048.1 adenylate/guanylate cyclase domain-containing protein [Microvirga mediterraneensis]